VSHFLASPIKRSIRSAPAPDPEGGARRGSKTLSSKHGRAATIRDVAKLAGTSVAAASAVINGTGSTRIRVGAATRQRIERAATELRYTTNYLARGLATGKTGVVGLVFPYTNAFVGHDPFSHQIMAGVVSAVSHARQNLLLHTSLGDEWSWNAGGGEELLDGRTDGLLLVLPEPHSRVIARCRREGFPYVALVYAPDDADVYAVNADDVAGGRLATEHLIGLGHRRIAHLAGSPTIATSAERSAGYRAALEAAGIEFRAELMPDAGFTKAEGQAAMARLLDLPPGRQPTAVFGANDLCAEGALLALREAGRRVPDDVAVVGYDDSWVAMLTKPPTTSVAMPTAQIATTATEMLLALVRGETIPNRHPLLPVTLTIRESCGASTPAPE
jgi:LacI family transcriptional regulator